MRGRTATFTNPRDEELSTYLANVLGDPKAKVQALIVTLDTAGYLQVEEVDEGKAIVVRNKRRTQAEIDASLKDLVRNHGGFKLIEPAENK